MSETAGRLQAAALRTAVVEILPPGTSAAPRRRAGGSRLPAPEERLVVVLGALGGELAVLDPISEAGFRQALAAFAPASLAALVADLDCFAAFCAEQRRPGLPAEAETITSYIDHLERRGLALGTVRRRLSSIASMHALFGLPGPTRTAAVANAIKALRRRVGSIQRQAAGLRFRDTGEAPEGAARSRRTRATLSVQALLEACAGDPQGLRDAALLSVGYDAGLRVSELVAIAAEHVEAATADDGSGLLFLPRSKTDQMGEGAYAWLSPDSMRRIAAWQQVSEIDEGVLFRRVGVDRRRADPGQKQQAIADLAYNARVDHRRMAAQPPQPARVRYHIGRGPLTRQGVSAILRRVARRAADLGLVKLYGVELDQAIAALSTHSLRVGLTQDLFAAGEDVGPIALALRWRSTATALRYARKLAPGNNAAARVLGRLRT
jgi:integrase